MVEASTTKNVPAASSQRNMFAIEAALASAALPKISKRGRISWLQEDLHSCEKNFESQKANYESNSSSGGEGRPMVAPQNRRNNSRGSPSCTESSIVLSRSNSGTSASQRQYNHVETPSRGTDNCSRLLDRMYTLTTSTTGFQRSSRGSSNSSMVGNALRADTMPRLLRKGQPLISAIISNTCHDHLPPLPAAPTAPHVYSTTSGVPSAGASAGRPHVCVAENPVLHESHRHATESFSFTSTPNALAAQGTSAAGANAYENKSEDSDCVLLELTAHHLQERRRGRQQQQRPVLQQPARESLPLFSWNPQEMVAAAVSAAAGSSSVMNTEKGAVVSSAAAVLLAGCARRAAVGGKSASGAVHLRQLVTSRRDQQCLFFLTGEVVDSAETLRPNVIAFCNNRGVDPPHSTPGEVQGVRHKVCGAGSEIWIKRFRAEVYPCAGLLEMVASVLNAPDFGSLWPSNARWPQSPEDSFPGLKQCVQSKTSGKGQSVTDSNEDIVSGEGDTDDWLLVEPDDDAFEAPFDASHISITDWSAAAKRPQSSPFALAAEVFTQAASLASHTQVASMAVFR
ncbi:uncharacterized protein LOC34623371 [Cyclospora cayetanensis]|uniref:Uncharacterized protein LOC34623371 n=1 Tax=Cyclospora cayetanensis TaxID=88456 RepID=A0A6P6RPS2_9EIME|nr:uncharacterized protein LOC34623371 [Cyclospora cayetanensis]